MTKYNITTTRGQCARFCYYGVAESDLHDTLFSLMSWGHTIKKIETKGKR